MKKTLTKIVSFILVLAVSVGAFCLATPVKAQDDYPYDCPVIYLYGQGCPLVKTYEDGTSEWVYPPKGGSEGELLINGLIKENGDVLAKAFFFQDWTEFGNITADILQKAYEPIQLDKNGNSDPSVRHIFDASMESVIDRKDNRPGLEKFDYHIDFRLDPFENARQLREYIEKVLEVTGAEQYSLISRCEGCNVVLAYWQEYKDLRIKNMCFYSGAMNGASPITEAFSGRFVVNAEALERYLYDNDLGVNIPITEEFAITDDVLRKILTMLTDTYGLDVACWAVENVYTKIYPTLMPRLMSVSFSTFPGYWAMVSDNDYDEAMKLLYGGKEEEYAGLIAKCDYYHKNVTEKVEELLLEAKEKGVRISAVVKYGKAPMPVIDNYDEQSDFICSVFDTSFGATATPCGKTFDKKYLENAKANGTDKYIGVDKCIDASTCLFPDTTWFLKNNTHKDYNKTIDTVLWKILGPENITVFDDPDCPQYLFYNEGDGSVEPLKAEHRTRMDDYYSTTNTFFRKIKPIFKPFYWLVTFVIRVLMLPPRIK